MKFKKSEPDTAYLSEIFSSIQGEGLYCGYRQLFIRFAGCNLKCRYCDTKDTQAIPEYYKIEHSPGSGKYESYKNPVEAGELVRIIESFSEYPHHSISLTGGEPLMQADFFMKFLPEIKRKNINTYLETNGVLYRELSAIMDYIDIISMDIKLPALSGLRDLSAEHLKFLKIASQKEVFVKMVIDKTCPADEIIAGCSLIAEVSPDIPLILQPFTEKDGKIVINAERLLQIQDDALKILRNVRVIPQMHRIMNVA